MILSLQEVAAAQGSYKAVFPEAAEKMKKTILKLKEAQACVPPCGVQEGTRRFRCRGCYSSICDLPLDCPVQDVTVTRGNQALFSCVVGFQLPLPELTYSWKFAGGGLRTQDMAYFRDVPGSHGPLARIRPVQPTHRGTFSCVILQDQRPLARLYFFLNGAVRGLERGRGLAGVALPSDVCARGSDRPSPAGGDGAAGHVPGSDELGTAGGGSGGAREAQPRGAAGPAAGADAGQPVLARGHRGARVRECHAAGVVSPSVCIGCPPQPGI
ncbi:sperm acrosome membrane-associated protein 6 isoform X6 [Nannospalax galili]|uniref:sperm acrosome membrane-associated protein 6 isoform X6 n=1 Tax=Nannospalax galili TaxID=1026970 RepID=UPI00111BE72F|nr:sperm acrosome membrane-associated protein 6 isoform X6 [Nannospalax galili]